jgi:hypothetical protein
VPPWTRPQSWPWRPCGRQRRQVCLKNHASNVKPNTAVLAGAVSTARLSSILGQEHSLHILADVFDRRLLLVEGLQKLWRDLACVLVFSCHSSLKAASKLSERGTRRDSWRVAVGSFGELLSEADCDRHSTQSMPLVCSELFTPGFDSESDRFAGLWSKRFLNLQKPSGKLNPLRLHASQTRCDFNLFVECASDSGIGAITLGAGYCLTCAVCGGFPKRSPGLVLLRVHRRQRWFAPQSSLWT